MMQNNRWYWNEKDNPYHGSNRIALNKTALTAPDAPKLR